MDAKVVKVRESIKSGWGVMKKNLGFFIVIFLIYLGVSILFGIIGSFVEGNILSLLTSLLNIFVTGVLGMGIVKIALKFCDNEKPEIGDLFACWPLFLKYLIGSILVTLVVILGYILLIIPGIIWSIKYSLFVYFIVDKNMGPVQAMKASSRATKGGRSWLLWFYIVCGLVNFIGILCLGIGIFATFPTTVVAMALVYRSLVSQTEPAKESLEQPATR